jgi:Carboxypeptidase regulatory-like domain
MKMGCPLLAVFAILAIPVLLAASASAQASTVKVVVVKDDNGKPVRNAAVILHPVKQNGKQAKGGIELKTDAEGRTESDGMPYGKLRVQVIAPGFQTFGDDYTINQSEQTVTIRLKRPQGQYTIYGEPGSGQTKDKQ